MVAAARREKGQEADGRQGCKPRLPLMKVLFAALHLGYDRARRMRQALDYVRALEPRYPPKLRVRALERTARLVRWSTRVPKIGRTGTLAALKRFERLTPVSERMVAYLRAQAPDVVVL